MNTYRLVVGIFGLVVGAYVIAYNAILWFNPSLLEPAPAWVHATFPPYGGDNDSQSSSELFAQVIMKVNMCLGIVVALSGIVCVSTAFMHPSNAQLFRWMEAPLYFLAFLLLLTTILQVTSVSGTLHLTLSSLMFMAVVVAIIMGRSFSSSSTTMVSPQSIAFGL